MPTAPQRTTSRNIDLDFLRGVAILSVLGLHCYVPESNYQTLNILNGAFKHFGGRGVDLFFVLSGFLIGGLLFKEYRDSGVVRGGHFLIRRAFKIWPGYYVFILFQAVVGRHPRDTFLLQNLLHLQNYLGSSLAQTWSLAIEEHFYLALAIFLTWASNRRMSPVRLIQCLAAVSLAALMFRINDAFHGRLDEALRFTQDRMDSLLLGVILAVLYWLMPEVFDTLSRRRWPLIAVFMGLAPLIFWLEFHPVWNRSIGFTVLDIALAALVLFVFRHATFIHNWLPYRFIAWVGLYSYAIYLWDTVTREPSIRLLRLLHIHSDAGAWMAAIALQSILAIGAGFVMTLLVEKPFLSLRDRFFPRVSQSPLRATDINESAAGPTNIPVAAPQLLEHA